jgi:hypothetical protein
MTTSSDIHRSCAAIVVMQRSIGIWKTSNLLAFIADWAKAMKANDWQPITLEQFQAHRKYSRASAFRLQALYRRVFPTDQTPNERVLAARLLWLDENTKRAKPEDLAGLVLAMPI